MKISIITPTFNSENTIGDNINSILLQKYQDWEQIIIDNKSIDSTLDLIKEYNNNKIKIISEEDNGIYDAINKGIVHATGDVISILHSDDFYYDQNTLESIVTCFSQYNSDIVYGDLIYVRKLNKDKVLRYWESSEFKKDNFYKGWSPPHPSFFVKKKVHNEFGYYDNTLGNPADIELMFRFLEKNKIQSKYLNKKLVIMRYGGSSNNNLKNILKQNLTILKILSINFNYFKIIRFFYYKIINRIKQFLKK